MSALHAGETKEGGLNGAHGSTVSPCTAYSYSSCILCYPLTLRLVEGLNGLNYLNGFLPFYREGIWLGMPFFLISSS